MLNPYTTTSREFLKENPQGIPRLPKITRRPAKFIEDTSIVKAFTVSFVQTFVSLSTIFSWYPGNISVLLFTWFKANLITIFTAKPPPQHDPVRGAYAPIVRFVTPSVKTVRKIDIVGSTLGQFTQAWPVSKLLSEYGAQENCAYAS